MKKHFLLLIISLLAFKVAHTQTNVSGGIYSNTTWTLVNSPYVVVDTVVVFPGVTLTIEPGVTIKFADNKRLEIRQANIIAQGTITDSIIFTSNSISPTINSWGGIYLNSVSTDTINLRFCKFSYATQGITNSFGMGNEKQITINSCVFSNNEAGIIVNSGDIYSVKNCILENNQTGIKAYQSGGSTPGISISDCVFNHNSDMGIALYSGNNSVDRCLIQQNGIGLYDSYVTGRKYIKNIIEANNIGMKLGGYKANYDSIFCNKICDNVLYNFEYTSNINYSIANNNWCATDSTAIAMKIFDGYDNINLGIVNFMPLDITQCYLVTGIETTEIINPKIELNIFPNPFSSSTTLKSENPFMNATLTVDNCFGQTVKQLKNLSGQTITFDRGILPNGLYFIRLTQDSKVIATKKLLITD